MTDEKLWELHCELAGYGEKLRVVNRLLEGLPLDAADQALADSGLGTRGEYIEAGRRQELRIVRHQFGDDAVPAFKDAVKNQLNEGTQKP